MKAGENKIIGLLSVANTQFSIPVYQRNYNWEKKQCEIILRDIREISSNEEDSHFIGSIVYMSDGVHSVGKNEFNVIDGQQRLTTITLLLIAILHRADDFEKNDTRDMILELYLKNKYINDTNKMKLILPGKNAEILKLLVDRELDWIKENEPYNNLYKNYMFFIDEISNEKELELLMNGINKLIYVDIVLEKGKDDPQRIFESLNSTGLDLSQGDLIRNFILMNLDRQQQNEIYDDYWIPIENNTKVLKDDEEKSLISEFLRDYLTLELGKIPNKKRVFEDFKGNYRTINYEKLKAELNKIKKYSEVYNRILNPEKENDPEIRLNLKYLKSLDLNVINPFIMGVYIDYKNEILDKENFIKSLEVVQSYLLRRYICGEPSNGLNKIFMSLYLKNDKKNYYKSIEEYLINQGFPTDKDFKEALKIKPLYKEREKLNYIFDKLENSCHNEKVNVWDDSITIEHIFPQKPSIKWSELFSSSEMEKMESLKDTIANLTLTGSNSNLGNKLFIEKRDMSNFGYAESKLFLNKWLGKQQEWNINKMDERFDELFKHIVTIWNRPTIKEKKVNEIVFYCQGPRGYGTGSLMKNNKFIVFKGSKASKELLESVKESNTKIINHLLSKKSLKEEADNYIFIADFVCSSPSAASRLILGRSSNGWTEWRTYEGLTLNNFKENDDK